MAPHAPGVARAKARSLPAPVVTLLAATFLLACTSGVVFPLLADLQNAHGLPTWGLGLIAAVNFFACLALQILLAPWADRGHAKALLLAGLTLGALGLVEFTLASSLWTFVLARATTGAAVGCFMPAARALTAAAEADNPGRALGRLASAETGGFVFGPVVGSVIADRWGLDAPFMVIAVAAVVGLVVLAGQRLPELVATPVPVPAAVPLAAQAAPPSAAPRLALGLLRQPAVLAAGIAALALYLPVGVYESLWARYLEDRGASALFIGVTLSLYGIPMVTLASTGGRLADRVGPFGTAVAGVVGIAPIVAGYGLLHAPLAIVSLAMVEAVIQACAIPGSLAAMARACPPGQLAAGQGLAGGMGQFAAGVTALASAPLYGWLGPEAVFGLTAGVLVVLAVAAWRIGRDQPALGRAASLAAAPAA